MRTRSKSNTDETVDKNEDRPDKEEEKENDEIEDDFYSCKICGQSFQNHDKYKKHKVSCKKSSKKHVCSKCSKFFNQKSLLQQHYDYRHTNKPKKFICEPCGKTFELKKSLQEHNHRLHDDSGKKYLCDFCSRSFWHVGEFTVHRVSHTGIKPFKCGRCGEKSFASAEHLMKHLKRCGIDGSIKCNQCGESYSDQNALSKHMKDVHESDVMWQCPLCKSKYKSEGGYYGHLRIKHQIGRNGRKLSTALIEQLSNEKAKNIEKQKEQDETSCRSDRNKKGEKETPIPTGEMKNTENDGPMSERKEDIGNRSSGSSKEMTHTCPFPLCNNTVLKNDKIYYEHLWDKHKLGRNK